VIEAVKALGVQCVSASWETHGRAPVAQGGPREDRVCGPSEKVCDPDITYFDRPFAGQCDVRLIGDGEVISVIIRYLKSSGDFGQFVGQNGATGRDPAL